MERTYKRSKKSTVQLTSLLDLLFVMIFVSLTQNKSPVKTPEPVAAPKPAAKAEVKPEVVAKKPAPTKTKFSIMATFNFYATAQNPGLPEGSYLMHGSYDQKSGKLHLGGVSWIQRPAHYDMVPLSGKINSDHTLFEGRIEFQGCQKFVLRRQSKTEGSPISGVWTGEYDCTQGATGLTLTIQ